MDNKYYELDKLKNLPLDQKIKVIEDIISAPIVYEQDDTTVLFIKNLPLEKTSEQSNKNEMYHKKVGLFLLFLIFAFNSFAQTIDNVAIGQVLASMPTGVTLRDGTLLKAEVIALGTASSSGYPNHGIYNQYDFGGIFNGVNDGLTTPTGPDGNVIVGYTGSKDPLNFTRINADPRTDIDRGDATSFGNAIGFHFWSDRPIIAKELLLIDCDGAAAANNREWFTIFGYNGTTAVDPTVSLHTATELVQGLETVNSSWYTLVNSKITGTVPVFTQKRIAKNATGTTGDNDPDDRGVQSLFDFGTTKVTNLFVLWGVRGDLSSGAVGSQNSGVSPLVFSFNFDYGDAPNTYGTNKASNGPVHVVPTTPLLTLGAAVTTENNGSPGALANGDTDDGVATIDSVLGVSTLSDVITTYSLTTSYNNTSGSVANYVAWIDWNNNGVFDASEGKTASTTAGSTSGTVTFTWTSQTLTRSSTSDMNTYARIRMTTEAITTANATNSPFQDGEVEDYLIPFASVPLPIHLLSFDATVVNNGEVMLKWLVADQKNVQRYEILRSTDGIKFTAVGAIDATDENHYSIMDKKPKQGVNLYKLNTIDLDGSSQMSANTLSVTLGNKNQLLALYPNPADNLVNINTQGYGDNIKLVVYNAIGQMELQKPMLSGINIVDISLLKSGVYTFKLFDQNAEISTSLVNILH